MALDAFALPLGPQLDAYRSGAVMMRRALGRDGIVRQLSALERDATLRARALRRAGVRLDPALRVALAPLSPRRLRALRDRRGERLDGGWFVEALDRLALLAAAAETAGVAARDRLAALDRRPPPWRDPAFVGLAAALLLATVLALLAVRRRMIVAVDEGAARVAELAEHNRRLTGLIDAMGRLGGSLEMGAVARSVIEEAARAVAGELALVALVTDDGLRPAAVSDGVEAIVTAPGQGVLGRVVESGVSTRAVVAGDAVLPVEVGPLSIVAAPLVAGGRVLGALLVARHGERLFADEDETSLRLLGMAAATALESARVHARTQGLALTDPLTGLGNRRRLAEDSAAVLFAAARRDAPAAVAMIDVDHFKAFNDTHGHPAGDAALRRVAGIVTAAIRGGDRAYRYGGEEMAVLLPETEVAEALVVAERIRAAVAIDAGAAAPLSVSIGVACATGGDPAALIAAADAALYAAKRDGRDRVVAATAAA